MPQPGRACSSLVLLPLDREPSVLSLSPSREEPDCFEGTMEIAAQLSLARPGQLMSNSLILQSLLQLAEQAGRDNHREWRLTGLQQLDFLAEAVAGAAPILLRLEVRWRHPGELEAEGWAWQGQRLLLRAQRLQLARTSGRG